jgi:hypothetical protein
MDVDGSPRTAATRERTASRWTERPAVVLMLLFPLYLFILATLLFSVNIPNWDDYVVFLKYINTLVTTNAYADRIASLLRQHNEHRIVLARIWAVLNYDVLGQLDFRLLVWLGLLPWLGLYFFFWLRLGGREHLGRNALPLALLFFPFSQWESLVWATISIQHYGMAACAGFTLYAAAAGSFYQKQLSIVFASLGVFVSGSGFLVFPLCWALYLLDRKPRMLLTSTACCLACAVVYFNGYVSPTQTSWSMYAQLLSRWESYQFAFTFLGSYTGEAKSALSLGILLAGCIPYLCLRLKHRESRFALAVLLFCLGSGLLSAGARLDLFGLERALLPYHAIFSSLSLAAVYLAFAARASGRWITLTPLFFVLLAAPWYVMTLQSGLASLTERSSSLTAGMRIYLETKDKNALSCYHVGIAEKALQDGLLLGTYRAP